MGSQFPLMIDVERKRVPSQPDDYRGALLRQLKDTGALSRVRTGGRVAVGVGSRGISNLKEIVSTVIECLRDVGAHPYLVPAMGSHGGGTPEGQMHVLAG